jgi:methylglutaconyl-CoA hydratase
LRHAKTGAVAATDETSTDPKETTMSVTLERPSTHHARLWLDRPDKRNAFDDELIDALLARFTELAQDKALRVITLGGRGKHFCAGADLNWMRAQGQQSDAENRAGAHKLAALLRQIDTQPQVVIARVQGAAFGGALGLICASHIAIGSDDLRFCLSEARLGILPAVISPYVVRAMGTRQARRYFVSCELIEAEAASRLNLVHEVVPQAELDARCDALVTQLLSNSPNAQRQARELIELAAAPISDASMNATIELIARLRRSDEGQEGMSAFLEKRSPAWVPGT